MAMQCQTAYMHAVQAISPKQYYRQIQWEHQKLSQVYYMSDRISATLVIRILFVPLRSVACRVLV